MAATKNLPAPKQEVAIEVANLNDAQIEGILTEAFARKNGLARSSPVAKALEAKIDLIREVLPHGLQHEARRFVKRAMLYFIRKPDLQKCTPMSFLQSVLDGAEMGLPIDGKLGHAVPYNCKKKVNGKDVWEKVAQFQPDYKGLQVVVRRNGILDRVKADLVRKGDHFLHGRDGDKPKLEHTFQFGGHRGEIIGAYCLLYFKSGAWDYELMDIEELDGIKNRTKSRGEGGKIVGPWVTDTNEMYKKTVIRRALKPYSNDPAIAKVMEVLDREYEDDAIDATVSGPAAGAGAPPVGQFFLGKRQDQQPEQPPSDASAVEGVDGEPEPEGGDDTQPQTVEGTTSPPPIDQDGGLADTIDDFKQRISEAKDARDLIGIRDKLEKQKDILGIHYPPLDQAVTDRHKQLHPEQHRGKK